MNTSRDGCANANGRAAILGSREKPPRMSVEPENIPAALLRHDRFLGWRWEWEPTKNNGAGKWDKPPINVVDGGYGSSTDPEQWVDFQTAYDAAEAERVDGVGFALGELGDGRTVVGIDLDDCRNPDTGEINAEALAIIRKIGGYWEVSPSGTGVKGLFVGVKPAGKCTKGKFEIYDGGKYFTLTGHVVPGCSHDLIDATDGIAWFHSTFIDPPKPKADTRPTGGSDAEWATELIGALNKSRADNYDDWLLVGMAAHSVGPGMFDAWEQFSQQSDKYDPRACREKWDSFNGAGVSLGSLYHWAKQDGWQPASDYVAQAAKAAAKKPIAPATIYAVATLIATYSALRPALIDGVCRRGETVNIISDPKARKSWLVLLIVLHICTGQPLFGRYGVTRGRVLIIDNELHPETLAHRIQVVAEALGLLPVDYADWLDVMPLRGNLRGIDDLAVELQSIEPNKYAAIVLDARYRFCLGDADENSNAYQASFYNTCDRIAAHLQAAVFLIHHSSKGSQADRAITDIGAGGGSQSRAADAHLVLRPHDEDDCYVLDGVVRSFPPLAPLALRWNYPLWEAADVDPLKIRGRKTATEQRQDDRDKEGVDLIVAALLKEPATARQLRPATGISRERLQRLLDGMESRGEVTIETTVHRGNECKVYSLKEDVGD